MDSIAYLLFSLEEYPFVIKLSFITSFFLFLTFMNLAVYLLPLRVLLRKREVEDARYKQHYEPTIIEFLYSGMDPNSLTERQEEIIKSLQPKIAFQSQRKAIISILTGLQNEVSGEMADSIKLFYNESGLGHYSLEKIKSKNWSTVARGIRELTRFNVDEGHKEVLPLINHKRTEIRNEAYLYLVNLLHFEGLSFLNNLEAPLSEWNQIQLLEVLQRIDNQNICDIKPWLLSKNDSVVLFALKLAQIYNQYDVNDTLMRLLNHPNKKIRIKAIDTLGHLYGLDAVEKLKADFNKLCTEEQISFFNMLEKLGMPTDAAFVEEHLYHDNFEIQLKSWNILKNLNLDKYYQFSELPSHRKSKAMLKAVPVPVPVPVPVH